MRLKSFQADSMSEAMAMVRASLGEDAIIISTREDKHDRSVRVTAAIEEFEQEPALDFGEDNWLYGDEGTDELLEDQEELFFDRFDDTDIDMDRPLRSITEDQDDLIDEDEGEYFSNVFAIQDDHADEDLAELFDFDLEADEDGSFIEQGFIEPITEGLLRHNLLAHTTDKIIASAIASELENAAPALVAALEDVYVFRSMPLERHAKPIVMIGPPGSGKTLATAKLAARAAMNGLKVAVITTDTLRAGGVEQLEAFTRVLGINLYTADDPIALEESIRMHHDCDQIFIDTPGVNPFNPGEMKMLADFLKVTDFDPVLVLSAGADANESADMARAFKVLGARYLMPTRLDIARRCGGILAAASDADLILTDASNNARVADGLTSLDPSSLSKILIPSLYNGKDSTSKKSTTIDL